MSITITTDDRPNLETPILTRSIHLINWQSIDVATHSEAKPTNGQPATASPACGRSNNKRQPASDAELVGVPSRAYMLSDVPAAESTREMDESWTMGRAV